MLLGLLWSPGPKLDEKYAKYANFDSLNPDIQSWASILCWNIFNDYLWSYMIESDMLKCAVTCFCIYGDLQYKKIIKNVPNIQIFPPPDSECPIRSLNIMSRHIQWLSIVIYNGNSYISMCFYLLRNLWWSLEQKISRFGGILSYFELIPYQFLILETATTQEQDAMHTEISFYIIYEHRQSLGTFPHNIEAQDWICRIQGLIHIFGIFFTNLLPYISP